MNTGSECIGFGLHLVDWNLPLEELIDIVKAAGRHRRAVGDSPPTRARGNPREGAKAGRFEGSEIRRWRRRNGTLLAFPSSPPSCDSSLLRGDGPRRGVLTDGHGREESDEAGTGEAARAPESEGGVDRARGARVPLRRDARRARGRSSSASSARAARSSARYRDPLGGHPLALAGPAHRARRADALPARPLRHAPQAPRRRDHARPRASSIPSWSSPRRRRASGRPTAAIASRRCAASAPRRSPRWSSPTASRLADPRAQHREGAQPEGALARGHPHLPRPARRGRRARPSRASPSTSRTRRS